MNINMTLVGQSIAFFLFVWFCMRFIWPPVMQALEDRRKAIADGLAQAERGRHELELSERKAVEILKKAKAEATEVVAAAERRAVEVAEEAKQTARTEADRIVEAARAGIDQEVVRAREQLRGIVAELAVKGAGRILEREVDAASHARMLDEVVAELGSGVNA